MIDTQSFAVDNHMKFITKYLPGHYVRITSTELSDQEKKYIELDRACPTAISIMLDKGVQASKKNGCLKIRSEKSLNIIFRRARSMSNCHDLFIKFHDDEIYLKSDKKKKVYEHPGMRCGIKLRSIFLKN